MVATTLTETDTPISSRSRGTAADHSTTDTLRQTLPPVDRYWNPGEETIRERWKLKLLHAVAASGGIVSRCGMRRPTNTVGILTWHRIAPPVSGVPFPTINVTPDRFRQQLEGLLQLGYQFASLQSVLDACRTGTTSDLPERTVVVTFDDIYDNVFHNAWPVLREFRIPVTAFISTAFVNSEAPFLFDPWARKHRSQIPASAWKPVTDSHLNRMLDSGLLQIGAHTHTHQDFRRHPQEFAEDLQRNIDCLRQRFGAKGLPFAFPYGAPRLGFCHEQLMKTVRRKGLSCGLTTGSHNNSLKSPPFGWGRFHVFQHDTPLSLAGKLDGWYQWLPRVKNLAKHCLGSTANTTTQRRNTGSQHRTACEQIEPTNHSTASTAADHTEAFDTHQ